MVTTPFNLPLLLDLVDYLVKTLNTEHKRICFFLPETHTDFIFAVLAENFGFLGSLIYFIISFLLISRLIKIALDLHLHFNRLLAVTYVIIFIVCFLINIAMVSGLFPIVGIPLPLISYGGSSLFIYLIIFGLINALQNRKTLIAN